MSAPIRESVRGGHLDVAVEICTPKGDDEWEMWIIVTTPVHDADFVQTVFYLRQAWITDRLSDWDPIIAGNGLLDFGEQGSYDCRITRADGKVRFQTGCRAWVNGRRTEGPELSALTLPEDIIVPLMKKALAIANERGMFSG